MRYFIEQQPKRFYNGSELKTVCSKAKKLTTSYNLVYVIAETYDADARDYRPAGSICFADGVEVGREGDCAA